MSKRKTLALRHRANRVLERIGRNLTMRAQLREQKRINKRERFYGVTLRRGGSSVEI